MPRIRITETMIIGHEAIDAEHRVLVDLYNEFYDSHQAGDVEGCRRGMAELGRAIASHVAHEEKIMQSLGYPQYEAHKMEHGYFLDKFETLAKEMAATGYVRADAEKLLNVLLIDLIGADMGIQTFLL